MKRSCNTCATAGSVNRAFVYVTGSPALGGDRGLFRRTRTAKATARLVDGLLVKTFGSLKHRKKGKPEKRLAHRGIGHRSLSAGRFLIVYYLNGDTVHITGFFDTRQSRVRG